MPETLGGVVSDGIYYLAERRVYSDAGSLEPLQQTLEISGSATRATLVRSTSEGVERRSFDLEVCA
jgi:hypothetical protein